MADEKDKGGFFLLIRILNPMLWYSLFFFSGNASLLKYAVSEIPFL